MSRLIDRMQWKRGDVTIAPTKAAKYSESQPRDSHGRWTSGGDGASGIPDDLARGLVQEEGADFASSAATALTTDGGFSLDPYGQPAGAHRYISSVEGHEQVFDGVNPSDLAAYHANHLNEVMSSDGQLFYGGWHNPEDGKTYLDVSTSFANLDAAKAFGVANHQEAIFDAQTGESIYLRARKSQKATKKPDLNAKQRGMYGHAINPKTGKPYRKGWK